MAEALPGPLLDEARRNRRALRLIGFVVFVLFLCAAALWARYGGAVFVELLAAAWAACF